MSTPATRTQLSRRPLGHLEAPCVPLPSCSHQTLPDDGNERLYFHHGWILKHNSFASFPIYTHGNSNICILLWLFKSNIIVSGDNSC